MKQQIRTRWHKLREVTEDPRRENLHLTAPTGGYAPLAKVVPNSESNPFTDFVRILDSVPKFVIEHDLLELVSTSGYRHSLLDMKEAGALRLPFPAMVVEMTSPPDPDHGFKNPATHFVLLRDLHAEDARMPWEVNVPDFSRGCDFYGLRISYEVDEEAYVVMAPSVSYITVLRQDGEPWLRIDAHDNGLRPEDPITAGNYVETTYKKDAGHVFRAACAAYLVMSTEGVAKEVIDTTRVNKARANVGGKQMIPMHTYIHIGKVYRSAGENAKSDEYVARKSPRPHWRRGHNRTVRIGKGRVDSKVKFIYGRLVALPESIDASSVPTPEYVLAR